MLVSNISELLWLDPDNSITHATRGIVVIQHFTGVKYMQTKQSRYDVGTKVVFRSVYGETRRTGQEARVIRRGNGTDKSGVAHNIEFADGHQMWAYPQELTLDTKK